MLRRVPLRFKISMSVVVLMFVTTFSLGRLSFLRIAQLSLDELGFRAKATAVAGASYIDPHWLAEVDTGQWRSNPEYIDLKERLAHLMEEVQIYEINLVRFRGGKEVEHVLSFLPAGDPDAVYPGQVENILDSPVYFQKRSGYFPVEPQRPGAYMGGWAPINDETGYQVGNLFVTIDFTSLNRRLDEIITFILVMIVLFTALAGFTGYRVGMAFEQTAVLDGLMGIYNHRHFKQRLEIEVARAARYKVPLSLVMIDIDNFKQVNDTYGHAFGDLVLKRLATWVKESARRTDMVARYGGEEIAVMLPHTGLAGAQEFAERLRLKVANEWVRDTDEEIMLRVTISLGVAQYERGLNMMDFIKRADAALYQSKHGGRNRVTIWTEELVQMPAAPEKQPAEAGQRV